MPLRLFVAVNLSAEIRERLVAAQEHLRRARADVSWVRPENIHITLKFLGETAEERVEAIRRALHAVASEHAAFRLAVAGVGTFGGRVPRVVWIGVTEGAEPLTALAGHVESSLADLGFPREKRGFTAHLTLGRVRSGKNVGELAAAIREIQEERFGAVAADAFELIQSRLHPSGSVYTTLDRFVLQAPGGGQEGRHAS